MRDGKKTIIENHDDINVLSVLMLGKFTKRLKEVLCSMKSVHGLFTAVEFNYRGY